MPDWLECSEAMVENVRRSLVFMNPKDLVEKGGWNGSQKWATTKAKVKKEDLQSEQAVKFRGEKGDAYFNFFHMWPDIIFRLHGSVIPKVYVELILALTHGILAWGLTG